MTDIQDEQIYWLKKILNANPDLNVYQAIQLAIRYGSEQNTPFKYSDLARSLRFYAQRK